MNALRTVWWWIKWPVIVLAVAYAALVIYRVPAVWEKERTAETIAAIQSQKITLSTVLGDALPPQPYQPENDATVEGIDKNNNGVRDDVELAVFAKYPHSAKIRAAELQYAMAIQLMITKVFNSETWIVAAKETSRGDLCISLTYPRNDLTTYLQVTGMRSQEVKDLVLNTSIRKDAWEGAYENTTSFSLPNTDLCNVDLDSLPN